MAEIFNPLFRKEKEEERVIEVSIWKLKKNLFPTLSVIPDSPRRGIQKRPGSNLAVA